MIKPKESTNPDRIKKALKVATQYHEGQFRKTGEPYINHCLAVTYILARYQQAPATLAAGLLHDTMEDCNVTYQDLCKLKCQIENVVRSGQLQRRRAITPLWPPNPRLVFSATSTLRSRAAFGV